MPELPLKAPTASPTDLRVRRVVGEDGQSRVELTVRCHSSGGVVPYSNCQECISAAALPADPTAEGSVVQCREPAPPRSRPPSGPLVNVPHEALHTPVREVMSRSVVCVTRELSAGALVTLLAEEGIGGVPVVDAGGAPIGMVSQSDLVWESYEQAEGDDDSGGPIRLSAETRVADLMTKSALSVPEGTSIAEAAAVMSFEGIHRLPVVDDGGRVVGIVTSLDLLAWISREAGYVVPARVPRGRRQERRRRG